MRLLKVILVLHSVYILATAVWPIIDIESFMWVTGYKQDIWLVKTVGALLIPVALTMALFLIYDTELRPLFVLAIGTAVAFIVIDIYYALKDVIADIYLVDAAVESIFLVGWIFLFTRHPKILTQKPN